MASPSPEPVPLTHSQMVAARREGLLDHPAPPEMIGPDLFDIMHPAVPEPTTAAQSAFNTEGFLSQLNEYLDAKSARSVRSVNRTSFLAPSLEDIDRSDPHLCDFPEMANTCISTFSRKVTELLSAGVRVVRSKYENGTTIVFSQKDHGKIAVGSSYLNPPPLPDQVREQISALEGSVETSSMDLGVNFRQVSYADTYILLNPTPSGFGAGGADPVPLAVLIETVVRMFGVPSAAVDLMYASDYITQEGALTDTDHHIPTSLTSTYGNFDVKTLGLVICKLLERPYAVTVTIKLIDSKKASISIIADGMYQVTISDEDTKVYDDKITALISLMDKVRTRVFLLTVICHNKAVELF